MKLNSPILFVVVFDFENILENMLQFTEKMIPIKNIIEIFLNMPNIFYKSKIKLKVYY
jgi:hypothetical protein